MTSQPDPAQPDPAQPDPAQPDAGQQPGPARPGPPRRHLLALLTAIAVGTAVVDQLTKAWALRALADGERVPLLGDWLGLRLVFNPGAALSIATGMTWVLTLIAAGVVVVIVRVARRLGSRGWAVALGLLLGGAVGNLVDRLLRPPGPARGHVIDFIAYADWFVGNVADIAIVVAAGLLVLLSLRGVQVDGSREHADDAPGADPAPGPGTSPGAVPAPGPDAPDA